MKMKKALIVVRMENKQRGKMNLRRLRRKGEL
jgi:hypothetical protein